MREYMIEGPSATVRRSIRIGHHHTSISLEDEFYNQLRAIAKARGVSLAKIVEQVDTTRLNPNLSSALRCFVLRESLQKV